MSGPARNPYRDGPVGIISEGAYADFLLWSDDPTRDVKVIEDKAKLSFIMKDGAVYKNRSIRSNGPNPIHLKKIPEGGFGSFTPVLHVASHDRFVRRLCGNSFDGGSRESF